MDKENLLRLENIKQEKNNLQEELVYLKECL